MAQENKFTFVVSDESLNRNGYRVMTSGIDLVSFKKNPIALWMHNQSSNWEPTVNDLLPIGKWENIRKEEGKLLADLVFDSEDEFAQKLQSKVEQGILNATSIGFRPLKTSSDEKDMVKGQQRATVTKAELREISLVSIPGNKNAIKLFDNENNVLNLSDSGEIPDMLKIQKLNSVPSNNQNSKKMDLVKLRTEHPALYDQVFNLGDEAGVKKENIRVKSWLAHLGSDSERVVKGIKENEELSADVREEMIVAANMKDRSAKDENAEDLSPEQLAAKEKTDMDAAYKEDVESIKSEM